MPFELRVAPKDAIARVRGWGDEDFETTLASMRRLSADPRLTPGVPVLFDIRELEYTATPPEVASFASEAMPALYTGRRVALLTRRGTQQGVARAFATKASQAGASVEVFIEPELAERWLREGR